MGGEPRSMAITRPNNSWLEIEGSLLSTLSPRVTHFAGRARRRFPGLPTRLLPAHVRLAKRQRKEQGYRSLQACLC
jgi:hypothetical protein